MWTEFDDDDSGSANDDDDVDDDDDDGVQPMFYHKSKKLNVSALPSLQKSVKFNDIEVDTNVSTVHVPTHVYDECTYRTCWLRNDHSHRGKRAANKGGRSAG